MRARRGRSERAASARKSESGRGREGRKASNAMTPARGLRARAATNVEKASGDRGGVEDASEAKVPPESAASAAIGERAVETVHNERASEKVMENVSEARKTSSPRGEEAYEDGVVASTARASGAQRAYADVQTPKNVKKIAWTEAAASDRSVRKSVRSVKRESGPVSAVKAADEAVGESAREAEKETEATETDSAKVEDGREDPPSVTLASEKKRRERKRANGLAFLKADIPALAAKNPQAGGAVVSTELKISPRTLAARKAKESAGSVAVEKTVEAKENAPPTVAALVVAPRSAVPKLPVDQRSLTESFMIQPESVSGTIDLAPLAPRPKLLPTPSQIKAFQSLATPSKTPGEQRFKLPSVLAPPSSAAELNDVMSRLKRAMEARSRADEENKRQLESELRQKEEERKRREKEMQERKARQADEEAREREERRLRQERLAQFRLQEEEAQRKAAAEKNKWAKMLEDQKKAMYDVGAKLTAPFSLKRTSGQSAPDAASNEAEKRRRLLENAQAAIQGHSHQPPAATAMKTPTRSIFRTNFTQASSQRTPPPESYPISPYCSSDSEDDDRPQKQIPRWARGDALVPQLKAQSYVDPDDIFPNPSLTCSLGKIFAKKSDRDRRRSSSNWTHDRLTLQEELSYKQKMGFR